MARKMFYSKRRKMPKSLQLYIIWAIFIIVILPVSIFFTSTNVDEIKIKGRRYICYISYDFCNFNAKIFAKL